MHFIRCTYLGSPTYEYGAHPSSSPYTHGCSDLVFDGIIILSETYIM